MTKDFGTGAALNSPTIVDRLDAAEDLLGQIREWIKNSSGKHFVTEAEQADIDAGATKDLPTVTSKEDFDALAPGAAYIDGIGIRRVK